MNQRMHPTIKYPGDGDPRVSQCCHPRARNGGGEVEGGGAACKIKFVEHANIVTSTRSVKTGGAYAMQAGVMMIGLVTTTLANIGRG